MKKKMPITIENVYQNTVGIEIKYKNKQRKNE